MGGKSLRKCEVCGVRRVSKLASDIFLARFPLNPDRCRLWVKATGNEDLVYLPIQRLNENKFVCGNHFSQKIFNKKGNRLKRNAVPNLGLNTPLSEEVLVDFPFCADEKEQAHAAKRPKIDPTLDCGPSTSKKHKLMEDPSLDCGPSTSKSKPKNLEGIADPSLDCGPSTSKSKPKNLEGTIVRGVVDMKTTQDPIGAPSQQYGYTELEMSPRKRKLIKKLHHTRNLLKTLSKTSVNLDNLESDILKNIVTQSLKNQRRKPQGKRWNLSNKISALQIFKRSPKTYRFLQHNISLPSVRTIQRLLSDIPMEPGINVAILNQLKEKIAAMPPANRICGLLFDEISLKKRLIYNESSDKIEGYVDYGPGETRGRRNLVADKALVFMIQGIRKKYKQPLAYYFVKGTISSENLASIIKEVIKAVENIGLTVITTICDQGPTNCGALSLLKKFSHLPPNANYFYVDSSKIYTIYDIPHVFKSIRNNFFEAGTMEYDGKIAKWQHLRDAEEVNNGMLYFHKITPMLLNPKQRMKMKVKYAAQTLSNTFAAVLRMIAEKHTGTQYGQEVAQTSEIVRDLNKLFDITNGPANPKDVIKGQRENVSEKSNHIEKWNYFLTKIPTIKFFKSASRIQLKNVRCIQGFVITITSLKDIWYYCQKKGFKFLNLRQMNQDSIENLFGVIRQSSPTNRNPTCSHFTSALKTVLISGLNTPHSRGANCEDDLNKLLFLSSVENAPCSQEINVDKQFEEYTADAEYPVITLPETEFEEKIESDLAELENQPVVYLSGYIAYRLLKNKICDTCARLLKEFTITDDPIYKYIRLREWWQDKQSLTYPSIMLCRATENAIDCFKQNIHLLHDEQVLQKLCTIMMVEMNFNWLICNQHQNIAKHFCLLIMKILIRRQCQIINDQFKQSEELTANANKIAQVQSTAK